MSAQPERPRRRLLNEAAATLDPSYFALVMATGIVSIGIRDHGLATLSAVLLWIAAAGYAALIVLTAARAVAFTAELRADLTDPRRGFGFFTLVAGTDVLGARLTMDGHYLVGLTLLTVGALAWLILGYLIPWITIRRTDRPVMAEANGTWFIWAVASQSVAVLAAALEPTLGIGHRELAFLAVVSWSIGVFLYVATGVLVTTCLMLYPPRAADLTTPYWIAMGATAITVLAGAQIVRMADTPMIVGTRGMIIGASVAFWAFGTWLIPPLLAAGWWRHITHRIPLRYDASLWSIVFPLGMYGVAGHDLGQAGHLPLVQAIGDNEIWVALAVWTLTFTAMIVHLSRSLARHLPPPQR